MSQPDIQPTTASTADAGPGPAPTGAVGTDERVHFDRQTGKWTFEDDDGNEMEWDIKTNAWVPVVRSDSVQTSLPDLERVSIKRSTKSSCKRNRQHIP